MLFTRETGSSQGLAAREQGPMFRAASSIFRRGEMWPLVGKGVGTRLQAAPRQLFSLPAPEILSPAVAAIFLRLDPAPPAARLASAVVALPSRELDGAAQSGTEAEDGAQEGGLLWDGLLKYIAPKKRTSYTRKRVRRNQQIAMRGPKLKPHLYICPVCERTRAPHRVCDREDCKTYFRSRWY